MEAVNSRAAGNFYNTGVVVEAAMFLWEPVSCGSRLYIHIEAGQVVVAAGCLWKPSFLFIIFVHLFVRGGGGRGWRGLRFKIGRFIPCRTVKTAAPFRV